MTKRRNAGGFTLIEIVVAFAILAVFFAVFFPTISDQFSGAARARDRAAALEEAKSLLDRVGHDLALDQPQQSGTTPGNLRWSISVTPYRGEVQPEASPVRLVDVIVTVSWGDKGTAKSVDLHTLRLLPRGGTR